MYDGVRESDEYPENPPSYPKIGYYSYQHNNNLPGPFVYQEPTTNTNSQEKEVNVSKIILRDKYPPFQEKIFEIHPKK